MPCSADAPEVPPVGWAQHLANVSSSCPISVKASFSMTRLRRLIAPLLALGTLTAAAPALADNVASPTGLTQSAESSEAMDSTSALGFFWQLTTPQTVLPGSYLRALETKHPDSKGTRSDEEFFTISSTGSNDVPAAALAAYRHAETAMAKENPGCQISWTLLAAIGRVESNHGRFGGAQLSADGVSRPAIRGPRLDGAGPFAAIRDSDDGLLDGDKVWDRAVGQMQFLPGTWRSVARDGDGNGTKDPNDIDDAALGSAVYLCGAGGSLANPEGMARAAFRYNHSDYYVQLVLSFQNGYTTGVFAVPSPPPPAEEKTTTAASTKKKKSATSSTSADQVSGSTKPPTSSGSPSSKPSPTPGANPGANSGANPGSTPPATPAPTPTPEINDFTGVLRSVGSGYTLDNVDLDLGTGRMGTPATADYDGDQTIETNGQELDGLVAGGGQLTLHGSKLNGVITVDKIGGQAY